MTPQPQQEQPTLDEILAQIAKNQAAMSEVIKSHEAQIKRLQYRIGRIEEP